jgi:hypothetical protein
LELNENPLPSFNTSTLKLSPKMSDLYLGNMSWNATTVNNALIYLDGKTFDAGPKSLDIRQNMVLFQQR